MPTLSEIEQNFRPKITVQRLVKQADTPSVKQFRQWVGGVFDWYGGRKADLCLRVVSEQASQALNTRYRGKPYPTNVLSFEALWPSVVLGQGQRPYLGDLLLCGPVIIREAGDYGFPIEAYWAHMVVHGMFHLLGFDHVESEEAALMEAQEAACLQQWRYPNPYRSSAEDR